MRSTPTLRDSMYDEESFDKLLESAETQAINDWESDFVSDMQERFDAWGADMFLSSKQLDTLERIAKR